MGTWAVQPPPLSKAVTPPSPKVTRSPMSNLLGSCDPAILAVCVTSDGSSTIVLPSPQNETQWQSPIPPKSSEGYQLFTAGPTIISPITCNRVISSGNSWVGGDSLFSSSLESHSKDAGENVEVKALEIGKSTVPVEEEKTEQSKDEGDKEQEKAQGEKEMEGRTDRVTYRVACTRLKSKEKIAVEATVDKNEKVNEQKKVDTKIQEKKEKKKSTPRRRNSRTAIWSEAIPQLDGPTSTAEPKEEKDEWIEVCKKDK